MTAAVPIGIHKLDNHIQNYAWGSRTRMAEFLGQPAPSAEPMAEMWMGAHPKAPSNVLMGDSALPLDQAVTSDPAGVMGSTTAKQYPQLPFLFKLLAADQALSIQSHPTLEQAREGFARENAAGIPITAPHRNYRDANHKPEVLCALTPFWAMNGFRSIDEIVERLGSLGHPRLEQILTAFGQDSEDVALAQFLERLLRLEATEAQSICASAVATATARRDEDAAWEWVCRLADLHPNDIGVLAPLFLNVLQLQPGEALFVQAGRLHAYLDGMGIELMANSDNVLRGGLTIKHVDVDELLATLDPVAGPPSVLRPEPQADGRELYVCPVPEFELSALTVRGNTPWHCDNADIRLCICSAGELRLGNGSGTGISLCQGESAVVGASVASLQVTGDGKLYMARPNC